MRNDYLFNNLPIFPRAIHYKTMHALYSQNQANMIPMSGLASGLPPDLWLPPQGTYVKLNFDGSPSTLFLSLQILEALFKIPPDT